MLFTNSKMNKKFGICNVLALGIAASLNKPSPMQQFGVFRM